MEYGNIVVNSFGDYNLIIQDYLNNGFNIVSYDDNSVDMVKKDIGSLKIHLLLIILGIWWSFGFLNILYLLYSYYVNVEAYRIILEATGNPSVGEDNSHSYNFDDASYIEDYLLKTDNKNSTIDNNASDESLSQIVMFLEE